VHDKMLTNCSSSSNEWPCNILRQYPN